MVEINPIKCVSSSFNFKFVEQLQKEERKSGDLNSGEERTQVDIVYKFHVPYGYEFL